MRKEYLLGTITYTVKPLLSDTFGIFPSVGLIEVCKNCATFVNDYM